MTGVLLRDAEIDGGTLGDVRIRDGRVTEIGSRLLRRGEDEMECRGGALLPGLCDHHLHLHALAAAESSVRCGPPAVTDASALAIALGTATAGADGWIRGTGYTESVAGDLDAQRLDRLHSGRPVRIQHRSGALWMVNSAGARRLALASGDHPGIERDGTGKPTGLLWRADGWLRERLPDAGPPGLSTVGRRLARFGITVVTDATPDLDDRAIGAIADAMTNGTLPQRVQLLGVEVGAAMLDVPGLTTGPLKIVLADSGPPDLYGLVSRIRAAHDAGRGVAVHVVTRESLALLLAAFEETGPRPGDRIEHGALIPAQVIPHLAWLGLRVVTQPGFLADRGDDYLREVPSEDQPDLYRCRSLIDGGVPLALSSDAPYGPLDPWQVLAAAARRTTRTGTLVGPAEQLPARKAIDAYLSAPDDPGGAPRSVRPGVVADLLLLDRPLADALREPSAEAVRAVLVAGRPLSL